jgi:hypothetical protein
MTCARFAQLASVVVRKVLLWAMVVGSGVSAVDAQIPELERPVTTSFGTYHPQLLQVEPRARWFEVAPGLANVHNAAQFDLPPEAIALLEEDGFFVATGRGAFYADRFSIGTAYQNFADVYLEAHEAGIPVFITSDVMLHVFHRLFDHVLMTTEEEFLLGETITLTSNLIDGLVHVRDDAGNPQTREIIDFACGHLAVGLRLLDPEASIPSWLETRVSEELGLIHAASGRELSPMFGAYWEDYSQYIPRGHYTRSEALERYFLGMMWFGRMTFALRGMGPFASSTEQRADLTAAALLLVRQLLVERGGLVEVDRWHTIYDPTHFMVGESDDLMYTHYADLAAEVYGAPLPLVAVETVCDPVLLQVFMDRAEAELPQPRIRGLAPQGLRLFGQRFIPDSWYFTELVHDSVDGRTMPSVLDVFSVLGSVAAEELQRSDGQEIYDGYVDQLLMLRSDVVGGPPEQWITCTPSTRRRPRARPGRIRTTRSTTSSPRIPRVDPSSSRSSPTTRNRRDSPEIGSLCWGTLPPWVRSEDSSWSGMGPPAVGWRSETASPSGAAPSVSWSWPTAPPRGVISRSSRRTATSCAVILAAATA